MKKALYIILAVAVTLMATVSFAADEKKCTSLSEAQALINTNHKEDAKACLSDMKTDVEANYLLGVIYFQEGNLSAAKDRFSAPAVKAVKSGDIYNLYKRAGDANANQGNFTEAGNMYEEALAYKAEARQQIANNMFELGKSSGKRGYFVVANRLDSSFGPKAGEVLNSQIQVSTSIENKIALLEDAAKLDKKYEVTLKTTKEAEGRGNLEQAKIFACKTTKEAAEATIKYKALARKYLGEAVVENELPSERTYGKGTYVFNVKAGEQTPHYIKFVGGVKFSVSSNDYEYYLVYKDGQRVKDGLKVKYPRKVWSIFKLEAMQSDQEITMIVK